MEITQLREKVKEARSWNNLFALLGHPKPSSNMYRSMRLKLDKENVDYSHFSSKAAVLVNTKYPRVFKKCPICSIKFETRKGHKDEKTTCSIACSNRLKPKRKKGEPDKEQIRRRLPQTNCITCGILFKPLRLTQKACSRNCAVQNRTGMSVLNKYEFDLQLKQLLAESGTNRVQRRSVPNNVVKAATRFYGSWNKAIKTLGGEPNTSKYQKCRVKSKDGHTMDSMSERIIDDYLFEMGIAHELHKRYPGSNLRCDWYLSESDTWVEYFGLYDEDATYTENADKKIAFCEANDLKLISIFPKDLYPKLKLDTIFDNLK